MAENDITEVKNDDVSMDSGADMEQKESEVNEQQFTDSEEKPVQDNRANAERRIANKHKREVENARVQGIIEAIGTNPYTGKEMKDKADVDAYLSMKELEKKGGDPIADYPQFIIDEQRRKEQEETELAKMNERATKELNEFQEKYPDVDTDALANDEQFNMFANGKLGVQSLSQVYADYIAFKSKFESKVNAKAVQMVANGKASVGSLTSNEEQVNDFITKDEVLAHREDKKWIHANYDKISKSMPKW